MTAPWQIRCADRICRRCLPDPGRRPGRAGPRRRARGSDHVRPAQARSAPAGQSQRSHRISTKLRPIRPIHPFEGGRTLFASFVIRQVMPPDGRPVTEADMQTVSGGAGSRSVRSTTVRFSGSWPACSTGFRGPIPGSGRRQSFQQLSSAPEIVRGPVSARSSSSHSARSTTVRFSGQLASLQYSLCRTRCGDRSSLLR